MQQPNRPALFGSGAIKTERYTVQVELEMVRCTVFMRPPDWRPHYGKARRACALYQQGEGRDIPPMDQPWALAQSIRPNCQVARISRPKPIRYQANAA